MSFVNQLSQAEKIASPNERAQAFNQILQNILTDTTGQLPDNLIAYVRAILSDYVGVVHSRPLLTSFVDKFSEIPDRQVKIQAGPQIVHMLQPRIVSFEQQDCDLKLALSAAYEENEDFTSSARALQTIKLEASSNRKLSEDIKAEIWMRICRCYLEDDNPTDASVFLNKVKQVGHNVTNKTTLLHFSLSQARIHDSQRNFLDASIVYYSLSQNQHIDQGERMQALSAAIKCAILAPAGPARSRQLGTLYKDSRSAETEECGILEKIHLERILAPEEVKSFASRLQEHQVARTSDGSTVLEKAILEHNLLAVSKIYLNISFAALGMQLGVDAERAENYAATMIESQRLKGTIDQPAGLLYFGGHNKRTLGVCIQELTEDIERIASMLS
ncbi:putative COP9 signalosome subunit 4 [Piedraia hortae CBS 480.64]|uniref:COP9 signalosome complex subunit 4 n=1 Tax=Piedraia hortae CBS 480.64 TaxID=1314780 RepID=A0A6A7C1N0_9PEZI|nr:putative COP9 signalosome subunit 4 [Piedraia hortae CBS 480.64]